MIPTTSRPSRPRRMRRRTRISLVLRRAPLPGPRLVPPRHRRIPEPVTTGGTISGRTTQDKRIRRPEGSVASLRRCCLTPGDWTCYRKEHERGNGYGAVGTAGDPGGRYGGHRRRGKDLPAAGLGPGAVPAAPGGAVYHHEDLPLPGPALCPDGGGAECFGRRTPDLYRDGRPRAAS